MACLSGNGGVGAVLYVRKLVVEGCRVMETRYSTPRGSGGGALRWPSAPKLPQCHLTHLQVISNRHSTSIVV